MFSVAMILFITNQGMEGEYLTLPVMRYYLDDLVLLPIFLPILGWIFKMAGLTDVVEISMFQVILSVIYFSIIFEVMLPVFFQIGVADPMDVLMYILGGMITLLVFRKDYIQS
ncbi:MAG: hypothetical protein HOB17_10740 [Candidatus Marinimicrobia bacterium]|nr:hypothetical protein [Candidatus Neomarinimicrobiota bacterium]MBT3632958.1 hypothetical protein [Candidatus Neomarinimicrobiota bacterium]MBT3682068.1 hypothetical protein [Candidatus Neomarinimicrobiota bacterium]MBT3758903.1 hypothetical protein [Candidatus Neomarinimicrobiota bacterium]MBT3895198.1 hypothetical protein [Candidatus Neomarinimicrobiota bacterium]